MQNTQLSTFLADVFQVCCSNGFRFASHLSASHCHSSDWLHVSICGTTSLLFSKLSKLLV